MFEQRILRADGSTIRDVFAAWLAQKRTAGARLVILEGLMTAGKSELTKEPAALRADLTVVELDKFLRRPVNPETPYMTAIDLEAATKAISYAMATASLVIAEGPMAWPVTEGAREGRSRDIIRRVYLRRMSKRNPDEWEELEIARDADETWGVGEYELSIIRYHREIEPWLAADLILERSGKDKEDDALDEAMSRGH